MTCLYAIHMSVVCAAVSLIAVTELVLVTSSDKKEIKGKYWRNWLTARLRGRRRPRATQRDNCKAWLENTKYGDLVRMNIYNSCEPKYYII